MTRTAPAAEPVPASAEDRIVTERLSKVYRSRRGGEVHAVDQVDLRVRPGEIFGLLGPNGAGKTTTIGMLTTRVVPTGGRAEVAGMDVARSPARVKQRIGVVPQTNTLDRSISVRENLYYHARYFGLRRTEAHERTAAMLRRFRLSEKAEVLVDELSGGMAQRLMLARALLHRPAVLFLDEPTTGLDPQARIALWDLLRDYHAGGQTILLTTHYMDEADQLCDRLAVMDGGRILALGSPAELKRSISADTVVHLSVDGQRPGRLQVLAERLGATPGVARADVVDGAVRAFAEVATGLLPRLIAGAEAEGIPVTDIAVSQTTLEDVFIALTGRDLRE